MKFVIVDDDEISLMVTKKLVQHVLGEIDISTFISAGEALRYLKNILNDGANKQVNLFLDLNMPVISGWLFLEFFGHFEDELKSRVHIYMLTSSIDPLEKRKALFYSNVIAFFSKPLTPRLIRDYFVCSKQIE